MKQLILFFLFSVTVFSSDFKVLTSLTTNGDYSGGIRYVKSATEVIDFGLSYDDSQSNSAPGYWVDYYNGYFGAMISAPQNTSPSYSLMFAAEGNLSSDVGVGIGFRIVDVQKNRQARFMSSWDAYLLIPINIF